jgi:hypothetical protein
MSLSSEKVMSLYAIFKLWEGSIDVTHMSNCKVVNKIIAISSKTPFCTFINFFLGFRKGWRADVLILLVRPTENMQNMLNMPNM